MNLLVVVAMVWLSVTKMKYAVNCVYELLYYCVHLSWPGV